MPAAPQSAPSLAACLENLRHRYGPEHLGSDPLQFPRRFQTPEDRETVAFVAASLAFGNARAVNAAVQQCLERLGPAPARAAEALAADPAPEWTGPLHRWVRAPDMARFLAALARLRRDEGSLESAFVDGDDGGEDLKAALTGFVDALRARVRGPLTRGLAYLLVSPRKGSACKRWNMLLRWLVRRGDGLDLGLWRRVDPSRLVVPLDTHVARISRYIGLTRRRTADWRTAADITRALSRLDPQDPVRYDFALARLGILDHCPRRRDPDRCLSCDLLEICTL